VRANRSNTVELPRRTPGAFVRWETPGEPATVNFHKNVVDLLERDLTDNGASVIAGVLLGRFDHGRKLTLTIEDYESIPNMARLDNSDSVFGDRHYLEQVVERWHSRTEKRISVVGFYRSGQQGQLSIDSSDLEILGIAATEPERAFLIIESQVKNGNRANLYLIRDGAVAWKWHSVRFNRKELVGDGTWHQLPATESAPSSPRLQKVEGVDKQDSTPRSQRQVRASRSARWGLGMGITFIMVAAAVALLWNRQLLHVFSGTFMASTDPSALGLKFQRVGNDWQFSWDGSSPILLNAAAGRLSITDGFIHKTLDLDLSELRSGRIMYTPVTDDVRVRLDVVSQESATLASETGRMVAGLLPSPSASMQTNGGSPIARVRSDKLNPLASDAAAISGDPTVPISPGKSSIEGESHHVFAAVPLSIRPPTTAIRHEIGNVEGTLPSSTVTFQDMHTLAQQALPPVPSEDSNFGVVPNSTVRDKPAELISRSAPVYPEIARQSHTAGRVELLVSIGTSGRVDSASVLNGDPVLARAALDAVKDWRYRPAQINGKASKSEIVIAIVFKLS
jgi:TonB family protein